MSLSILGNIKTVFGREMFNYVNNIVEKGKVDYLVRLPDKILLRIISNLDLESVSRLSQVNNLFRQVEIII